MSRKITEQIIDAFLNRKPLAKDNSHTDGTELFLWGHRIAYHKANDIIISMCGYNTNTTRERLSYLLSELNKGQIRSKNSTPYFINELGEYELDPYQEYSLNTLTKYVEEKKEERTGDLHKIFGEGEVSLEKKKTKTENQIGKKVKCWHCGSDQKIQSLDHTFECTNCNEPLWTGEGGFVIV